MIRLSRALVVVGAWCLVACTAGSSTVGDDDDDDDGACNGPLGAPIHDLSVLDQCCTDDVLGQAHCLDAATVPAELAAYVDVCPSGGYCIPDSFITTGGAVPPAACTAFGGAGVCLSRCIPQVKENINLLRQDVCADDELCVPCISPLDGMPTHACDLTALAVCDGDEPPPPPAACDDPATCDYEAGCAPVIDPSTLSACAADAHCVDASIINGTDPTVAGRLAPCENPSQLCVPDVFITTGGKFTPPTCTSVNNNEGRCLSLALPEVAGQADMLPQSTCADSERCTPCYNPIDGTSTGACDLSCDVGPTAPAMPFAECCGGAARCVPQDIVPPDQTDQLDQDSCTDAQYCVPNEILLDGPFPTCDGSSFLLGDYTGVCLSECLDFGIQGLALDQGSCTNDYKCVPCEQFGSPTGAPGCPP